MHSREKRAVKFVLYNNNVSTSGLGCWPWSGLGYWPWSVTDHEVVLVTDHGSFCQLYWTEEREETFTFMCTWHRFVKPSAAEQWNTGVKKKKKKGK